MRQPRGRKPKLIDSSAAAVAIIDHAKLRAAERIQGQFDFGSEKCESPIERLFLAQCLHPDSVDHLETTVSVMIPPSGSIENVNPPPIRGLWIYPQIKYDIYRIDFILVSTLYDKVNFLFIECDGHDFHERTKEQAARDKARDRFFTSQGFHSIRFTGSEIFRDPEKVVGEAIQIVTEMR